MEGTPYQKHWRRGYLKLFTQKVRNDESVHLTEKNRDRVGKLDRGKTEGATSVATYSKFDRETQDDLIDFKCSRSWLSYYAYQGLIPDHSSLRRRRPARGRNTNSLRRPITSEAPTEEVRRQWSEIAELRAERRDWLKQKRDLEIQIHILQQQKNEAEGKLRFLQQRSGTAQHRETSFKGIPSVEFRSTG